MAIDTSSLTITPVHSAFAAEVSGVDLTRPLDDATFERVAVAFDDYSVLVFRGQALTDEEDRGALSPAPLCRERPRAVDLHVPTAALRRSAPAGTSLWDHADSPRRGRAHARGRDGAALANFARPRDWASGGAAS